MMTNTPQHLEVHRARRIHRLDGRRSRPSPKNNARLERALSHLGVRDLWCGEPGITFAYHTYAYGLLFFSPGVGRGARPYLYDSRTPAFGPTSENGSNIRTQVCRCGEGRGFGYLSAPGKGPVRAMDMRYELIEIHAVERRARDVGRVGHLSPAFRHRGCIE